MANDKKFVPKNGLRTQNISFVDADPAVNEILVRMVNTDTLSFSGDSGQLFSITDSMTGTIFAVNDISGVPSIEVDDDGTIRLAELDGNVLIGTNVDDGTNKLQVTGSISGSSTVTGTQFISTIASGTAPLTVTSTTLVDNLNADLLDGNEASAFPTLDGNNVFTGRNKISIQNSTDGGTSAGLYMWNDTDPNWVIYMATAAAGKAADGGTSTASIDGRTDHHIRYRVNNTATQGHLWENSNDSALMSLTADTGRLHVRERIYPSNQTTDYVDSTRIQNWQTAYSYSQVGHLPLAGGTVTGNTTFDLNDTDPTVNYKGVLLDHDLTGTTASTTPIIHNSLDINLYSNSTWSAGTDYLTAQAVNISSTELGDALNLRSIYANTSAGTGSDLTYLQGIYCTTNVNSSGTASIVEGINSYVTYNSANPTVDLLGVTTTVDLSSTSGTGSITRSTGVKSTTFARSNFAGSVFDTKGFHAVFDNDTAAPFLTNSYLFYGEYQGTLPTATAANSYGLYISGAATHYLDGNVGIGTVLPSSVLHIERGDSTAVADTLASRTTDSRLFIRNSDTTTGNSAGITLNTAAGSNNYWFIDAVGTTSYGAPLTFSNRTGSTTVAERVRIDSNGNVGIGTGATFPSNLEVADAGGSCYINATTSGTDHAGILSGTIGSLFVGSDGNYIAFCHQAYGSRGTDGNITERMRISSAGNVGIGTDDPLGKFHVRLVDGDVNPVFEAVKDNSGGVAVSQRKARGTVGAETIVQDGDIIGGFFGWGHDGTEYIPAANFRFIVDGTPSTGSMPMGLTFRSNNGTSEVNAMNIGADGNVDITSDLNVGGLIQVTNTTPVLALNDSDATNTTNQTGFISFQQQGTETGWVGFGTVADNKLTVRNTSGPVVLQPSTEVQVASNLDVTGNLEINSTASAWSETTPGLTTGSIHLNPSNTAANVGNAITWGAHDSSDGDTAQAGIYVRSDSTIGTRMYFATSDAYVTGSKVRMSIDGTGIVTMSANVPSTTTTSGTLVVTGGVGISENLNVGGAFTATSKSFDIEHPTKEGQRLRYGSLEGPENGVYVRGRQKNNRVIELPDYWTGLVYEDSITVNLTPIGGANDMWVEDIRDNKVYIGSYYTDFEYFFTVFAERKDIDKLTVEYEA